MKVSVIIPVFNAENYLDRCLKSVVTAGRKLGAVFEDESENFTELLSEMKNDNGLAVIAKECQF